MAAAIGQGLLFGSTEHKVEAVVDMLHGVSVDKG